MLYFIVHAVIFTLSDNSSEIHGILWQIFVIEFNHFLFYTVVSTAVTVIKTLLFIISAVLLCCWSVNWNHLHSLHDCSYLKPYCLWNINMSPVENHLAFFVIFCVGIEYWYFTYFLHFLGSLTTFQVSCYIRVCRKLRSIFWFFMLWFSCCGFHFSVCDKLSSIRNVLFAGNPGVAQFYGDFIEELYRHCRLPIHCVSHAGHVTVPPHVSQCQ